MLLFLVIVCCVFNSVVVFPFFWVVVVCLVVGLIDCGGLASLVLMLICFDVLVWGWLSLWFE